MALKVKKSIPVVVQCSTYHLINYVFRSAWTKACDSEKRIPIQVDTRGPPRGFGEQRNMAIHF